MMFFLAIIINGIPGWIMLFGILPKFRNSYDIAVKENVDEKIIKKLKLKYHLMIALTIFIFILGFYFFPPIKVVKSGIKLYYH